MDNTTMREAIEEVVPRKVRLWLYIIGGMLLLGLTAFLASEGDLMLALVSFLGTLQSALAVGNLDNVKVITQEVEIPVPAPVESTGPRHLAVDEGVTDGELSQ